MDLPIYKPNCTTKYETYSNNLFVVFISLLLDFKQFLKGGNAILNPMQLLENPETVFSKLEHLRLACTRSPCTSADSANT